MCYNVDNKVCQCMLQCVTMCAKYLTTATLHHPTIGRNPACCASNSASSVCAHISEWCTAHTFTNECSLFWSSYKAGAPQGDQNKLCFFLLFPYRRKFLLQPLFLSRIHTASSSKADHSVWNEGMISNLLFRLSMIAYHSSRYVMLGMRAGKGTATIWFGGVLLRPPRASKSSQVYH